MLPMRRNVFTLCAALSLLLCAATCTLWVRSIDHMGAVERQAPNWEMELQDVDGVAGLTFAPDRGVPSAGDSSPVN